MALNKWLIRLLACALAGLAMAGTTYVCAFLQMQNATPYQDNHIQAVHSIVHLEAVLKDFHKAKGRYPEKLADMKGQLPEYLEPDTLGQVLDVWKHPFAYQSDGESYTLRSLGLDGEPGGVGLATDVDAQEIILKDGGIPFPFQYRVSPTFWQYTIQVEQTRPVIFMCALAGLFTAIACFLSLKGSDVRWAGAIVRLLGTLIACFLVTMFLTLFHIPSHH